jgi:hypothetical protein
MKPYIQQFALFTPPNVRRNRRRHTKLKKITTRLIVSLVIAGLIYWAMR